METLSRDAGCPVLIPTEKADFYNKRILASSSLHVHEVNTKHFFCPALEKFSLLFFRSIFTKLGEDNGIAPQAEDPGDGDDNIPIEAFQRTFERLFYILGDDAGFSAEEYDQNSNGFVGWGEFSFVYEEKNMAIHWSIWERIYRTFDDPDSSHLAQFVSIFVLLTITASSLTFILSTVPDLKDQEKFFDQVELVCLIIFCIEYVFRLCTCWAVRPEVLDKEKLLQLAVGDDVIVLSTPLRRILTFCLSPSNLIDLAAIAPGVIGAFVELDGGGFVVLRLVRLTRVFRAFKSPTLQEPVIVIRQTMQQSTKALYILAFNLMLGIVIFGSLMYLCEKGEVLEQDGLGFRKTGEAKNETTGEVYSVYESDPTPFASIPTAFWWAVVTATTVGYGDMYPITSVGYVVAAATMIFSLVILALPIGVIGGNFTEAWENVKEAREKKNLAEAQDRMSITASIQKITPFEMRRLMLVEVWNERFPPEEDPSEPPSDGQALDAPREGTVGRPQKSEFLGEVMLPLDLQHNQDVFAEQKLPLKPNHSIVQRDVAGTITLRYEWKPRPAAKDDFAPKASDGEAGLARQGTTSGRREYPDLFGDLEITLVAADNLLNVCYSRGEGGRKHSNPYCILYVYPQYIGIGTVMPQAWRSWTFKNSLSPQWEASSKWNFAWRNIPDKVEGDDAGPPAGVADGVPIDDGKPEGTMPGEIANLLKAMTQEMTQVRTDINKISGKISDGKESKDASKERVSAHRVLPEDDTIATMQLPGTA